MNNIRDFIIPTRAQSSSSFFNRLFTETSDCIASLWSSVTDIAIQQRRQSQALSINDIAIAGAVNTLSGSITTALANVSGNMKFWVPGDAGCTTTGDVTISNGYIGLTRTKKSHILTAVDEFGINKADETVTVYVNGIELRDASIYRVLNGSKGYYWYASPTNQTEWEIVVDSNAQGRSLVNRLEYVAFETLPSYGALINGIEITGENLIRNQITTIGHHEVSCSPINYDGRVTLRMIPYNTGAGYIVGLRYLDFGEYLTTEATGVANVAFTVPVGKKISALKLYDNSGFINYDISAIAQVSISDSTGQIYTSLTDRWPLTRSSPDMDITYTGTSVTVSISFLKNSPLQVREITLVYE